MDWIDLIPRSSLGLLVYTLYVYMVFTAFILKSQSPLFPNKDILPPQCDAGTFQAAPSRSWSRGDKETNKKKKNRENCKGCTAASSPSSHVPPLLKTCHNFKTISRGVYAGGRAEAYRRCSSAVSQLWDGPAGFFRVSLSSLTAAGIS